MDRLLKTSIIFCLLIITLSIVYYFVVYLPAKDRAKEKLLQMNSEQLDLCLDQQFKRYIISWGNNCKELGNVSNCDLSVPIAQRLDSMRKTDEEDCYKRFPIK